MSQQPQQVNLKIKGLYTAANDFSGVPDGSLDVADDCVINYENLCEPRRGFIALEGDFSSVSDRVHRFASYQDQIIVSYGTSKLAYYDSVGEAWVDYSGTYAFPDATLAKTRFFEANKNLYISTAAGVYKLDAYNATPAFAGVPKGLDLQLSLTGSSGFLTANNVDTVTATTTSASPNLSKVSSISELFAGQYIYGTGIPSGTTISSITPSVAVLITTGTTTAGSTSLTALPTNAGLAAGQLVSGVGILEGTRISSISGAGPYTVTLDTAAIASGTGIAVTFYSDPVVTMSANATASGTVSLVFSEGSQVGYRILFGIRDANNNLIYGAPSQFASVTNNTGTTSNVSVSFSIPSGITVNHFYQIYRSPQTASASITPQDDEQLVYEANPTSGEISAGTITITDSTPDSLRGAYLYTSASQDGIEQANEQPPFCKDFCAFKTFGIYANVKSKQRKKLTILAVGGSNGIAVDDTLVIGGVTFTAKASETVASGFFKIFTTGTPAQNISDTANSLIKVINRYATNTTTYAYLISGPSDLPGQILIEERGVGGSAFAFTASARGSAYSPALPTSGTTVESAQDVYKNGIMISKNGEFEAVPTVNLLFAGSASKEILRVIPLREYVAVLKQDGVFRLTGDSLSNFAVNPFDLTTKLIAPETAAGLANEVYGLFDQGVCSISDTGVNLRSLPIDDTIRALIGQALSTIVTTAFGVGYETEHKYILALPDSSGDEVSNQQFVFDTFTNAWTRWTRSASAGFINLANNRLYLGNGSEPNVSVERKTNTYRDYVDEGWDVTIVSSSLYNVTLSSTTDIQVGDVLFQSDDVFSIITAVNGSVVTVSGLLTWANSAAQVLPAIDSSLRWKPVVAGNPAFVRQYSEGVALFKRNRFVSGTVSMYSDVSPSFEDTPLIGFPVQGWGSGAWGGFQWGGISRPRPVRFLVPQNKQMASQLIVELSIRSGFANWACEGLSISFNPVSQEVA